MLFNVGNTGQAPQSTELQSNLLDSFTFASGLNRIDLDVNNTLLDDTNILVCNSLDNKEGSDLESYHQADTNTDHQAEMEVLHKARARPLVKAKPRNTTKGVAFKNNSSTSSLGADNLYENEVLECRESSHTQLNSLVKLSNKLFAQSHY